MNCPEWIRESNLIEGIDRPDEDNRSTRAWNWFKDKPLTIPNILELHKKITRMQLDEGDAISPNSPRRSWESIRNTLRPGINETPPMSARLYHGRRGYPLLPL